jgi:spore maturation protein CgeB
MNRKGLDIAFFGSSLVSAYWNGAATYYRGIVRALAERGHRVTFFEPDAYDRQQHRDMPDPPWATVVVYLPAKARRAYSRRSHARASQTSS